MAGADWQVTEEVERMAMHGSRKKDWRYLRASLKRPINWRQQPAADFSAVRGGLDRTIYWSPTQGCGNSGLLCRSRCRIGG